MIRYAKPEDVSQINDLGETLHNNFSRLFDVSKMLNEDISKVLVSVEQDTVIGFIIATCLYETVDILSIVVDSSYRRKKIASNMIDYLISELDTSVETITLEVAVNNIPAISLYEKFGFEVINTRKQYYNGIDAYLMGRRLK